MALKDNIRSLVGEQEFNNVLLEVEENLTVETKNFNNTKKISNVCLVAGVICLFIPALWIIAAILLVIGLATLKLKTDSKKKVDIFSEVKYFLTEDVESTEENSERYKYLINQL